MDRLLRYLSNESLAALRKNFFRGKRDGVDLDEFVACMTSSVGPTVIKVEGLSEKDVVKEAIELFRQIDANGDGVVDWDEFTGFIVDLSNSSEEKNNEASSTSTAPGGNQNLKAPARNLKTSSYFQVEYNALEAELDFSIRKRPSQLKVSSSGRIVSVESASDVVKLYHLRRVAVPKPNSSPVESLSLVNSGSICVHSSLIPHQVVAALYVHECNLIFVSSTFKQRRLGIIKEETVESRPKHFLSIYEMGESKIANLRRRTETLSAQKLFEWNKKYSVACSSGTAKRDCKGYRILVWKLDEQDKVSEEETKDNKISPCASLIWHRKEITKLLSFESILISSSIDGTICFWDLQNYSILYTITHHSETGIRTMDISRIELSDEVLFTSLGYDKLGMYGNDPDCAVAVWDVNLTQKPLSSAIESISLSLNTRLLGHRASTVDVSVLSPEEKTSDVSTKATYFLPHFITCDSESTIFVWDAFNFTIIQSFRIYGTSLEKLQITILPDNAVYALLLNGSASTVEPKLEKVVYPQRKRGYNPKERSMSYSDLEKKKRHFLWKFPQALQLRMKRVKGIPLIATLFSSAMKVIITMTAKRISLWDVKSGKQVGIFRSNQILEKPCENSFTTISMDERERKVIIGDSTGVIRVCNLKTGAVMKRLDSHEDGFAVTSLHYIGPDENVISTGRDGILNICDEKDRIGYKPRSNKSVLLRSTMLSKYEIILSSFSTSLKIIVTALRSQDNKNREKKSGLIVVWDSDTLNVLGVCNQRDTVTCMQIIDSHALLVVGDTTGRVISWGLPPFDACYQPLCSLSCGVPVAIKRMTIQPDLTNQEQRKLFLGDATGSIHVFDVQSILDSSGVSKPVSEYWKPTFHRKRFVQRTSKDKDVEDLSIAAHKVAANYRHLFQKEGGIKPKSSWSTKPRVESSCSCPSEVGDPCHHELLYGISSLSLHRNGDFWFLVSGSTLGAVSIWSLDCRLLGEINVEQITSGYTKYPKWSSFFDNQYHESTLDKEALILLGRKNESKTLTAKEVKSERKNKSTAVEKNEAPQDILLRRIVNNRKKEGYESHGQSLRQLLRPKTAPCPNSEKHCTDMLIGIPGRKKLERAYERPWRHNIKKK